MQVEIVSGRRWGSNAAYNEPKPFGDFQVLQNCSGNETDILLLAGRDT